jgi:hypothetical protein
VRAEQGRAKWTEVGLTEGDALRIDEGTVDVGERAQGRRIAGREAIEHRDVPGVPDWSVFDHGVDSPVNLAVGDGTEPPGR